MGNLERSLIIPEKNFLLGKKNKEKTKHRLTIAGGDKERSLFSDISKFQHS